MDEPIDDNFNLLEAGWVPHADGYQEIDKSISDYFKNSMHAKKIDLRMNAALATNYLANYKAKIQKSVAQQILKAERISNEVTNPEELFTKIADSLDETIGNGQLQHERWRVTLQHELLANLEHVCTKQVRARVKNEMIRINPGYTDVGVTLTFSGIQKFIVELMVKIDPQLEQMYKACLIRQPGQNVMEWTGRVAAARATAKEAKFALSDSAWADMLYTQLSAQEKLLIGRGKNLEELIKTISSYSNDKFARYRPDYRVVSRIPMVPTKEMFDVLKKSWAKGDSTLKEQRRQRGTSQANNEKSREATHNKNNKRRTHEMLQDEATITTIFFKTSGKESPKKIWRGEKKVHGRSSVLSVW